MDLHGFQNPPKSYRPMVRWWWPGLDVEKEELLRELDDLDRSGVGGAELQPFMIGSPQNLEKTDPQRAQRTHRFMQPYHYEMISAVLDEAERRGMTIDITQNSAWPTGGTHITPEDSHQTLLFGEMALSGPRDFNGPVPPLKPPGVYFFFNKVIPRLMKVRMLDYYPQDKKLVRVVAGRLLGRKGKFTSWKVKESARLDLHSMLDLTGSVDASGRLHWQVPAGSWQLFAFYAGTAGASPLLDVRSRPGAQALVLDHFSRAALRRHLEAFLGQGKERFGHHFGRTLRAVFTDSLELLSPMHWHNNFLAEFQKRRGYDVAPYLPVTYVPLKDVGYYTYGNELTLPNFDFPGDAGQRIRYDMQRTISELFIEEFIDGAAQWMAENGLLSRVQGYGMLADPLLMLGRSHIPETEQLYGGGALNFFKLAGSAASLYRRPLVTSETLVWSNRPYMTTPLKWRVGIDRLFESGINQVIYHGFPYRHPDYAFPGFQPFASPHTPPGVGFSSDMSRDNPLLFNSAPAINAYAARAQYLLQRSKTRAALGIFYQLFDYPNGNIIPEELVQGVLDEQDTQLPSAGPVVEIIMPTHAPLTGDRLWTKECAALGSELVANGYYYQFFNEDSLLKAVVKDGKAHMGEAAFETLVLFKETLLPAAAAEKLRELADAGIPVLFVGSRPERDPGYFEHEARDQRVKAALETGAGPLLSNGAVIEDLRARAIAPQVIYAAPQPALGFIHKIDRASGSELFFLRNRTRLEHSAAITLRAGSRVPVEYDLWNGTAVRLPFQSDGAENITLALTFSGYTARMLALVDAEAAAEIPESAPEISDTSLETVLALENFAFTAQQRLADGSRRPLALSLPKAVDWRALPGLAGLSDTGSYQVSFSLAGLEAGARYFLCFERVCDRAEFTLNGQALPPLLVMPWRVELTGMLREGENTLVIQVTPTLRNALVAYANAGAGAYKPYRKQPTMAAGIIGAVRLCKVRA